MDAGNFLPPDVRARRRVAEWEEAKAQALSVEDRELVVGFVAQVLSLEDTTHYSADEPVTAAATEEESLFTIEDAAALADIMTRYPAIGVALAEFFADTLPAKS